MFILTLQLTPDEKPFIGIPDRRAVEMLAEAMSDAIQQGLEAKNPEMLRVCHEYANGRSCVEVIWVTEPAAKILKSGGN